MAGYSGTALIKKLGVKEGFTVVTYQEPKDYWKLLGAMPDGVAIVTKGKPGSVDFVHLFADSQSTFEKQFLQHKKLLKKDGMMWISWPKKSSKVPTDLTETIIRDYGLANGLVDVKVCAVDEIWSGLKFVYRLVDR